MTKKTIKKTKTAKRVHSQPPWQAQILQDVIQAVCSVLGNESRGIYLVLPSAADASTVKKALIAAELLVARLTEQRAVVE